MTTASENKAPGKFTLARIILILGLTVLLVGETYFGYRVQTLSEKQEQLKEDYSTANNITFGVFSVDQWRDKMVAIVNGQVHDFSMSDEQKKALQAQIEGALNGLIDKTVNQINKPQKGLGAKLKKMAFNAMVNTDDIHAQVPSFARTIINKVNSPASQDRLKGIATSKVTQLAKQTFDSTSTASHAVDSQLFRKYNVTNAADFNKHIDTQLADIRTVTYDYAYAMVGCVLFALCLWLLMRKQAHLHTIIFVMSLLFALVLLEVGTTASIIEVDARLKTLSFALMGQNVTFSNQVLFFQSKSILEIVSTLINQSKPDAVTVGVLIFLFVVILPLLRIVAKIIHILSPKKIAKARSVTYLAFDSAKWDMADVMIVGIFMTYIGLNGILKSQLSNLNMHNGTLTTITENNTSLQPGYFIFVCYVLFAVLLGYIFKKITPYNVK